MYNTEGLNILNFAFCFYLTAKQSFFRIKLFNAKSAGAATEAQIRAASVSFQSHSPFSAFLQTLRFTVRA